jgi:hypothetical protein
MVRVLVLLENVRHVLLLQPSASGGELVRVLAARVGPRSFGVFTRDGRPLVLQQSLAAQHIADLSLLHAVIWSPRHVRVHCLLRSELTFLRKLPLTNSEGAMRLEDLRRVAEDLCMVERGYYELATRRRTLAHTFWSEREARLNARPLDQVLRRDEDDVAVVVLDERACKDAGPLRNSLLLVCHRALFVDATGEVVRLRCYLESRFGDIGSVGIGRERFRVCAPPETTLAFLRKQVTTCMLLALHTRTRCHVPELLVGLSVRTNEGLQYFPDYLPLPARITHISAFVCLPCQVRVLFMGRELTQPLPTRTSLGVGAVAVQFVRFLRLELQAAIAQAALLPVGPSLLVAFYCCDVRASDLLLYELPTAEDVKLFAASPTRVATELLPADAASRLPFYGQPTLGVVAPAHTAIASMVASGAWARLDSEAASPTKRRCIRFEV